MSRLHRSLLGKFPGISNLVEDWQRKEIYSALLVDFGNVTSKYDANIKEGIRRRENVRQ